MISIVEDIEWCWFTCSGADPPEDRFRVILIPCGGGGGRMPGGKDSSTPSFCGG